MGVKIIVIGGSWGGLQASLEILSGLPADFNIPIVLVLHRLKNFDGDLESIYRKKTSLRVMEVDEKESIKGGSLYIAPPNYHVLIEENETFSLDASEPENYSRPSIDVTFNSAAEIYGKKTLGILLSGANKDGSLGLSVIGKKGGIAIVQDPREAEVDTMPQSAIDVIPDCKIYNLIQIRDFLISL